MCLVEHLPQIVCGKIDIGTPDIVDDEIVIGVRIERGGHRERNLRPCWIDRCIDLLNSVDTLFPKQIPYGILIGMSQIIFFQTSLFFYFLGCLLFLLNLWDKKGGEDKSSDLPISQKIAFVVTGLGFLCHTIALVIQLQSGIPFNSLKEAISFFSWAIVLIFFWVELRYRVYVMGSLILPMAFLSLISAATLPVDHHPVDPTLKGTLLGVHTTLSVLGIVAFAIAAVAGIMYLVQEKFLKSKQFGPLYYKLPALDLLDQWNETALFWGIPLLTLGIITGALWSQYALGFFWSSNSTKQLIAISAWFFYLIMLQGRITFGFRARRAALLSIIGFVGIIFIFTTLS